MPFERDASGGKTLFTLKLEHVIDIVLRSRIKTICIASYR